MWDPLLGFGFPHRGVTVQLYSSWKNHIINDTPGRRVHICYCVFLKQGERERQRDRDSDWLGTNHWKTKSTHYRAPGAQCSTIIFFLMGNRAIPNTGLLHSFSSQGQNYKKKKNSNLEKVPPPFLKICLKKKKDFPTRVADHWFEKSAWPRSYFLKNSEGQRLRGLFQFEFSKWPSPWMRLFASKPQFPKLQDESIAQVAIASLSCRPGHL